MNRLVRHFDLGSVICLLCLAVGCGPNNSTEVLEVPADNPYQATEAEMTAERERRNEEAAAIGRANN